ncbi:sensory rhodopsin transducer [Kallotenue papyrolyticum]|uniref:sensory rhodopsin transducer n=1 Tax=Kallotenue papyrolyticum TaxID=1325125 RepID=UPI00046F245A|nr:sensory rhodopsin transducer [Kallotenue papyrolyticum]
MRAIGHRLWAIPGGWIPLGSTGHEPEYTSYDQVCVLNTGDQDAHLAITIFYADREPVGPYHLTVPARRTRHVRFNDLIDPEAIPLETAYASVIEADVPVVVQFNRQDTRQAANAIASAIAFAADDKACT